MKNNNQQGQKEFYAKHEDGFFTFDSKKERDEFVKRNPDTHAITATEAYKLNDRA